MNETRKTSKATQRQ